MVTVRINHTNGNVELPQHVVDSYPDFPSNMDSIGKFTYLRTYARYIAQMKRREVLRETAYRAVGYSVNLERKFREENGLPENNEAIQAEYTELYDNVFHLKQWLSGRTMWVGGAPNGLADKFALANFNCSFTLTEKWNDIKELFYLLLVGTGVGFKTIEEMCEMLLPVRNNFVIENEPFNPVPKNRRSDDTYVSYPEPGVARIRIGDSKEGWVEALGEYLTHITEVEHEGIHTIRFNYDWVREKGERLKTFGGTASGHQPLLEMFEGFRRVVRNEIEEGANPLEIVGTYDGGEYVRVRPIHVIDMCNLVGYNVVVGGVRRTSEIAIVKENDWEAIFAKYGINGIWGEEGFARHERLRNLMIEQNIPIPFFWDELAVKHYDVTWVINGVPQKETFVDIIQASDVANQLKHNPQASEVVFSGFPYNEKRSKRIAHRRMSNNSIGFLRKPPKAFLKFLAELMEAEGEPGYVNLYQLAVRRLKAMGKKYPSEEEILALAYHLGVNPCGEIDLYNKGVCNLTTINALAFVHNGKLDREGLLRAQHLSARAGLRMTLVTLELPNWHEVQQRDRLLGCSLTGWKSMVGETNMTDAEEEALLRELRKQAHDSANAYADELGINRPLLSTTIKPEGTGTLVLGAGSSGLHYPKIRKGIRRIRVNAKDPIAQAVLHHEGWVVNPETDTAGETHEERMANASTLVIDFPLSSEAKLTEQEVDVETQFASYFRFQRAYTDHNSSNTIVVEPHEWAKTADIVHENWDDFVGVSFLAKSGGTYQLAPYEQNPTAYEELKNTMTAFNMDVLAQYEVDEDSELYDSDCKDGNCAIR